MTEQLIFRRVEITDHEKVIRVVNDWWAGRRVESLLPKLFFIHFRQTGFVVENNREIVGFLVGFFSQTFSNEAYIHFAGVHPQYRKQGVARMLYEKFFSAMRENGRTIARCITSPENETSIKFHRKMGFTIEPQDAKTGDVFVYRNYDARGGDRVLFVKNIDQS